MSKKKNTLKDLDEFLKQQAATLVSPDRITEPTPEKPRQPEPEKSIQIKEEISSQTVLANLRELALKEGPSFRNKLYDLIIKSLEAQNHTSGEDKMLINTALYLKHGDNWKEGIKEYWSKNK